MPASTTFLLRRGTAAQWSTADPVLSAGEPGFETDTGVLGVGDGVTTWSSLTTKITLGGGGGPGDVVGPSSAVDDRIATFDGVTGKLIQDGGSTIAGAIASAVAASGDVDGPTSAVNNQIAVYDGVTGKLLKDGGSTIASVISSAVASSGDVDGPGSAVANNLAVFDGTTGKLIKDGGAPPTGTNTGDVSLAGSPNYLTLAGQVLTRALVDLASHITGRLPFANLTQGSALSVLGVTGNATADHASIAAGSDKQVLRRSGTAVGFGAIDLASSAAVAGVLPVANFATGTPTGAKFVRDDGVLAVPPGAGDVVGPGSSVDSHLALFDGTTGKLIKDGGAAPSGANTGDVTLAGSPNYLTLAGQVITRALIDLASHVTGRLPFANLTQGSALSVLGVTGNASADNASIAAASDHQVLRRSGTAVGFGAVNLAQSAAVTGVLPGANGGLGYAGVKAAGIPYTLSTSYIDGTGTAGSDASAATVKTIAIAANTLTQVGDRLRIRVFWRGDTGAAGIVGTTTVNGVTVATSISNTGTEETFHEIWLSYIDSTHANIQSHNTNAASAQQFNQAVSAANVAGFSWTASQNINFDQSNVASNHAVVYEIVVTVYPKGVVPA